MSSTAEPPQEVARELGTLLGELLGTPPPGPAGTLPELGGESVQIIRIATAVAARFGVDLPLEALLGRPTVGELADTIAAAHQGASS